MKPLLTLATFAVKLPLRAVSNAACGRFGPCKNTPFSSQSKRCFAADTPKAPINWSAVNNSKQPLEIPVQDDTETMHEALLTQLVKPGISASSSEDRLAQSAVARLRNA